MQYINFIQFPVLRSDSLRKKPEQLYYFTTRSVSVSQKNETNVDFVSMCVNHFDKHPTIVDINNNMNATAFSCRCTTAATVEKILRGLNVKKATGQDRIPPKLVKPAAAPLNHHLANIFNQCVDTGAFPDDVSWQRLCRCTEKTITST